MRNKHGFVNLSVIAIMVIAALFTAWLSAPLFAQPQTQRRVTIVNATSVNLTPAQFNGVVCLVNASGAHTVNVGNASSYKPGQSVVILDTKGVAGNWTITSVSNINGGANYSMNNDTYQGVEVLAVANSSSATAATHFVVHARGTPLMAPSP